MSALPYSAYQFKKRERAIREHRRSDQKREICVLTILGLLGQGGWSSPPPGRMTDTCHVSRGCHETRVSQRLMSRHVCLDSSRVCHCGDVDMREDHWALTTPSADNSSGGRAETQGPTAPQHITNNSQPACVSHLQC